MEALRPLLAYRFPGRADGVGTVEELLAMKAAVENVATLLKLQKQELEAKGQASWWRPGLAAREKAVHCGGTPRVRPSSQAVIKNRKEEYSMGSRGQSRDRWACQKAE